MDALVQQAKLARAAAAAAVDPAAWHAQRDGLVAVVVSISHKSCALACFTGHGKDSQICVVASNLCADCGQAKPVRQVPNTNEACQGTTFEPLPIPALLGSSKTAHDFL